MNQLQTENSSIRSWLERPEVVEGIGSALSGWMAAEEFLAQILIALERPDIKACTAKSRFEAAHTCASLALLPSVQHVALIPRRNKSGHMECHVMPQWQGYKALMERNPCVQEVTASLVFTSDDFAWQASSGELLHEFDPFDSDRVLKPDLSNLRGGYLRIDYRDSRLPRYHFVPVAKILKVRSCAETTKVWDKWPEEQALKSVYRDAYARRVVPIDPLVNKRLEVLTQAEDKALGNNPNRVRSEVVSNTERLAGLFARQEKTKAIAPPDPESVEEVQRTEEESQEPPDNALDTALAYIRGARTEKTVRERHAEVCVNFREEDEIAELAFARDERIEQLGEVQGRLV